MEFSVEASVGENVSKYSGVGEEVGPTDVRKIVGDTVGSSVGELVGKELDPIGVGVTVGETVGETVGDTVGEGRQVSLLQTKSIRRTHSLSPKTDVETEISKQAQFSLFRLSSGSNSAQGNCLGSLKNVVFVKFVSTYEKRSGLNAPPTFSASCKPKYTAGPF